MKSLIKAVAVALVLAAPVASFAQADQPVTRAQVRAELVQLEKAGYYPGRYDTDYPANPQAAEARVAAQNGSGQAVTTGFGGVAGGVSQSGRPAETGPRSVYFGQ